MWLNKSVLYFLFCFSFFWASASNEESVRKGLSYLSNKEKLQFVYEVLGGAYLKYHLLWTIILYGWKTLFYKTLDKHPKYARFLKRSIPLFVVAALPVAGFSFLEKLPVCSKYFTIDSMFRLKIGHYLGNLILFELMNLPFLIPLDHHSETYYCQKKCNDHEIFIRHFQLLNNESRKMTMQSIMDVNQHHQCNIKGNCISNHLDYLEHMIDNSSDNFFYCNTIYNVFKKNISDELKLKIFERHILDPSCSLKKHNDIGSMLVHLHSPESRKKLALWYGEKFNTTEQSFFIEIVRILFSIRTIKECLEKNINFYQDFYLVLKTLLESELQKIIDRPHIYHWLFSVIPYDYNFTIDENIKKIFLHVFKDLFSWISDVINDESRLYHVETNGYRIPLQLLVENFCSVRQEILEYVIKNDKKRHLEKLFNRLFQQKRASFNFVQYALNQGIDINKADEEGNFMIHHLVKRNDIHHFVKRNDKEALDILELLINAGCNINAKNKEGFRPLDYARKDNIFLIDFLKNNGAISSDNEMLLNIEHFEKLDIENRYLLITKFIQHLLEKNVKFNIRSILESLYPTFIDNNIGRKNNDAIIFSCMQYHLEHYDNSDKNIINELSVVQNCIIELYQNSEKYKIGDIYGGNLPALYGDWLLEIVNKRFELNTENNITKIEHIDLIFNWFVSLKFPCDFTRTCNEGHNIFHKISYGGLLCYFEPIMDIFAYRNKENMLKALTQKGRHEKFSQKESLTPLEVAKEQEKSFKTTDHNVYAILHQSMQKTIEELGK